MPSRIYFPLRSNGSALLTGRPVAQMRRRLLRGAILYDEVYLEAGVHRIWAGPRGSMTNWSGQEDVSWQTPRERGRVRGNNFSISFQPTDKPESPFQTLLQSPADIAWEPTFEPFKRELGKREMPWLHFGHMDDPRKLKSAAGSIFNPDLKDPRLQRLFPEKFVRDLIVKHATIDLDAQSAQSAPHACAREASPRRTLSVEQAHELPDLTALEWRGVAHGLAALLDAQMINGYDASSFDGFSNALDPPNAGRRASSPSQQLTRFGTFGHCRMCGDNALWYTPSDRLRNVGNSSLKDSQRPRALRASGTASAYGAMECQP